ncbi:MAG: helix-turn-helix domain-containing protein [Sporolactobacillus sp.]|jgi:AraC-like DNA-binding protein/mannose-6-phosphate isomerase-like protein (cupin superfamily)|nr:helix-turn-helix domain-containing protein [Sporolactobacillus sp.]
MLKGESNIKGRMLHFTDIEKLQSQSGRHIQDIPHKFTRFHVNHIELLNNYFFQGSRLIFIGKHNRFADYPLHAHQYTELNYMLSGSCKQIVNGQSLKLQEGDILLIGIGSSHEIKALGIDDLLINISFKKNAFSLEWLNQLKKDRNPLLRYFVNLKLRRENTAFYYVFHVKHYPEIQQILKTMINEYYATDAYSNTIAVLQLPILFTLLVRMTKQQNTFSPAHDKKMLSLLRLIDENYQDISLAKAAKQLGYNKTYLGNMIKKNLGVNFTQLVLKRRLFQARFLLSATDLPISDVAAESGFSNKTYFYRVFKQKYGYLPGEEKRKH